MSPDDRVKAALGALRHEVQRDLDTLAHVVAQTEEMLAAAKDPSAPQLAFLALCIDRAYSACEAALLRIARQFDGVVPAGNDWHTSLLHQMLLPIQDVRPAVLRQATAVGLEDLLRFRHFLRHAYHADLEWGHLRPLATQLPTTARLFSEDMTQAVDLLFGAGAS